MSGLSPLQVVYVEEAAVEEGDPAQQRGQVGRSLSFGLAQAVMEELQQELAIELLESAVTVSSLDLAQLVAEVVVVAI